MAWNQILWAADILQVYRDAVANDPVLKAADATRQANLEARPQARALLLPDLGIRADQGRSFGVDVDPGPSNQNYNTHNYNFTLNQSLYDRGNLVRQRQADIIVKQADVNYLNAQQDLILRVAQGYFGVLTALDTLNAVTAAKNAFARQLEQANQRFQVGLATITDVYDAQARFDLAVADEVAARRVLDDSREALRQLTGQYYQQLSIVNEKAPFDPPKPSNPEVWIAKAMENNPQLQSASLGVQNARENIRLQKAGHYPSLGLNAGYFDTDTGITGKTSGAEVTLTLNVPLYQGGAVNSRTRQAAYQHEAAKQDLQDQQFTVTRQVRDTYEGVLSDIRRIRAYDQARISNRSALEANQAGFEVGTRTIIDVLDATRDLYLAERNYSVSRYDYVLDFVSLLRLSGEIKESDLEKINRWLQGPKPNQFPSSPYGEAGTPARSK
jgi:outer membrane protein